QTTPRLGRLPNAKRTFLIRLALGSRLMAICSIASTLTSAFSKQYRTASMGNPAQCFTRLRRKPRLSSRGGMRAGVLRSLGEGGHASAGSAEVNKGTTAVKPWGSTQEHLAPLAVANGVPYNAAPCNRRGREPPFTPSVAVSIKPRPRFWQIGSGRTDTIWL